MKKIKCMPDEVSVLGGVCGGFAYAFGINVAIIRILFIICLMAGGSVALFYILCYLFLDEWDEIPEDYER